MMGINSFNNIKSFKCALMMAVLSVTMLVACRQEAQSQAKKIDNEEKCEGDVLVQLGEVKFLVPRNGTYLISESGEELILKNCPSISSKKIREIKLIDNLSISNLPQAVDYYTTYKRFSEKIHNAEKNGDFEIVSRDELPSQKIKKFKFSSSELYVMPISRAPTGNDEPIVFNCSNFEENRSEFLTDRCDTSYVLPLSEELIPSQLLVSYDFSRARIQMSEYLEFDTKVRKHIESLIQKN